MLSLRLYLALGLDALFVLTSKLLSKLENMLILLKHLFLEFAFLSLLGFFELSYLLERLFMLSSQFLHYLLRVLGYFKAISKTLRRPLTSKWLTHESPLSARGRSPRVYSCLFSNSSQGGVML